MGQDSNIEWTHHTFNPWMGCTKVSAGCANCYAENLMDTRYGKVKWGDNGTRVIKKDWSEPRKWNKLAEKAGERHRVFCASLADVFEDRPELVEPRGRLLELIQHTENLDWLLLTKRPENIIRLWDASPPSGMVYPMPNVWLGTSIENQATADERIPHLLRVPAAVRFLSVEPLLGAINITDQPWWDWRYQYAYYKTVYPHARPPIDWVIVGGESGAKARPCNIAWIRSIVEQCKAASVPVFLKQLGALAFEGDGKHRHIAGDRGFGVLCDEGYPCPYCGKDNQFWPSMNLTDRKGGDMSEWPQDLRVRELPAILT